MQIVFGGCNSREPWLGHKRSTWRCWTGEERHGPTSSIRWSFQVWT